MEQGVAVILQGTIHKLQSWARFRIPMNDGIVHDYA
jgi:hypothetical protein